MVPWFWFLNLFSDCRIFQNKSVPDIVEQVFQDRGFSDFESRLRARILPREYCVQYRETDFNFVSRLIEEEGIFYFFEHTTDKHTLVLADDVSRLRRLSQTGDRPASCQPRGAAPTKTPCPFWKRNSACRPALPTHRLRFHKAQYKSLATLAGQQKGEAYDYPGKYSTNDDGDQYAKIRLEELEVGNATVRGESNCMSFQCGYKFTLSDHYRDSANMDYTLLIAGAPRAQHQLPMPARS